LLATGGWVEEEGRYTREDEEEGRKITAMMDAMIRSLDITESTAQEPTSKYLGLAGDSTGVSVRVLKQARRPEGRGQRKGEGGP
jgi:hypothetical protein